MGKRVLDRRTLKNDTLVREITAYNRLLAWSCSRKRGRATRLCRSKTWELSQERLRLIRTLGGFIGTRPLKSVTLAREMTIFDGPLLGSAMEMRAFLLPACRFGSGLASNPASLASVAVRLGMRNAGKCIKLSFPPPSGNLP